jgi:lipoprotein-releasing system permease protein
MRIFFFTGAMTGVVGTVAGFIIGLSFSLNIEAIRQWLQGLLNTQLFPAEIYFLTRLPAKVDSFEVALVVLVALAFSFLAPLYPAWRAARLDPVEALRYE